MLRRCIITLVTISFLFVIVTPLVSAETPYTNGSVWYLSFVKSEPNMQEEYIKNLQGAWKKVMDAALEQGIVLSYKIFIGDYANPDDWDILLMVEYENFAALDNLEEKFTAISETILGTEEEQIKENFERGKIREIFGGKLMMEITIK